MGNEEIYPNQPSRRWSVKGAPGCMRKAEASTSPAGSPQIPSSPSTGTRLAIFDVTGYGIAGDALQIVPALTEAAVPPCQQSSSDVRSLTARAGCPHRPCRAA
jgi:hypothetical protein